MIDTFRKNIAPPSRLHPADWCAEHVYVENSERAAKFDPLQMRYWRKPMGCFSDFETKTLVCIMPTGAGKSTFFEAITCWIISERPGSLLYASQTDADAQLWKETRLMPAMRRCKPLDGLWPANLRKGDRRDVLVLPHMYAAFGGANVSNFQEKSITIGNGDEAAFWKHGLVKEFFARGHNRENRKFTLASQAGVIVAEDGIGQTSELHLEHDKCRKWDFAWKCSSCSAVHAYSFAQLKWDEVKRENGKIDDQATADTVRRVCPGCAAEYPDTPDARRALHDSYDENDGYLLTSDEGRRGFEGFHVDRGAMWWCSWADDVLKKLAGDRLARLGDFSGLREWTQKDRAVGYSETAMVEKIELKSSGYVRSDFDAAQKIENEVARFMAQDVGSGHAWVGVRAFAEGGDSKLLFAGYVGLESELREIQMRYNVPDLHVFRDVGWEQEEQAELIAKYGWQGLKGEGAKPSWDWAIKTGTKKGETERRLFSHKWFAKGKTGVRAQCWFMATCPLQNMLQRLIAGDGAKWEVYDDAPPTYAKHLNGEQLIVTRNTQNREVRKWTRVGANHFRDVEVMLLCAALMFRVFAPAESDMPAGDGGES